MVASSLAFVQASAILPVNAVAADNTSVSNEASNIIYGDADQDGMLSIHDAVLIENYVIDSETYPISDPVAADVNLDGNINIVEDVTVPEDITLVIIPETKITVKDGCKLIAKGDVKDFSSYNYDLSGNTTDVEITTTTTMITTSSSTTTESTLTTTSTTSTTSKTSSTTSTTVTTGSTSTTETNSGNSSNSYDELPQTGNNSMINLAFIFGAILLILVGASFLIIPNYDNKKNKFFLNSSKMKS